MSGYWPWRDLASGMQLLWLPVPDESAASAIAALEALFKQYGPPLVLKSDNGSAFIAHQTAAFLSQRQVWHLRSPPEWPEYNGACEAGIGSMKARTHHQAARQGHPGEWTCDNVEAGRLQANETARPWGLHRPTPGEAWQKRQPITPDERSRLEKAVKEAERQAAIESNPKPSKAGAIRRAAISHALVAQGLLEYRRGADQSRRQVTE